MSPKHAQSKWHLAIVTDKSTAMDLMELFAGMATIFNFQIRPVSEGIQQRSHKKKIIQKTTSPKKKAVPIKGREVGVGTTIILKALAKGPVTRYELIELFKKKGRTFSSSYIASLQKRGEVKIVSKGIYDLTKRSKQ
jgi:hypothetical protein